MYAAIVSHNRLTGETLYEPFEGLSSVRTSDGGDREVGPVRMAQIMLEQDSVYTRDHTADDGWLHGIVADDEARARNGDDLVARLGLS